MCANVWPERVAKGVPASGRDAGVLVYFTVTCKVKYVPLLAAVIGSLQSRGNWAGGPDSEREPPVV